MQQYTGIHDPPPHASLFFLKTFLPVLGLIMLVYKSFLANYLLDIKKMLNLYWMLILRNSNIVHNSQRQDENGIK